MRSVLGRISDLPSGYHLNKGNDLTGIGDLGGGREFLGFPDGSVVKQTNKKTTCNSGDAGAIPENPMDRGEEAGGLQSMGSQSRT